jgi:histidinol-phosphate aminotransferase
MICDVEKLARPSVRDLVAYSSARSIGTDGRLFLDANENPWAPRAHGPIETNSQARLNRYPNPQPNRLMGALADLYQVPPSNICLGRGADEAIDTITRTFCDSGSDSILMCPPTYGMYRVAAQIQGANVVLAPTSSLNGFLVSVETILNAWSPPVKVVFICSPNNPTGNLIPRDTILEIASALRERAIVVVDEAYIEFSDQISLSQDVKNFSNLIVLRTLSKAWGLAGLRIGCAIAHEEIVQLFNKVRAPYPLSSISAEIAADVLQNARVQTLERIERLRQGRTFLAYHLSRCPQVEHVFPSDANFVLVQTRDAATFMRILRDRGIIVRDRSEEVGLQNCVRISVGSEEENAILIEALIGERGQ